MFLFALIILGVLGIVAWQIFVINSKFQETPSGNRANTNDATPELEELLRQDRLEDPNSLESLEAGMEPGALEENVSEPANNEIEENPYMIEEQVRTGDLADILGRDPLGIRQQNANQERQSGLYHQILSLPRISPSISPSNGSSGFSRGLLAIDPPSTRQSSRENNNYNTGSSPLNQAVGNVMSRNNNNSRTNSYQGGYQYNPPSPQGYVNVNPNQPSGSSGFSPSMGGVNNINSGYNAGQVYQPPQQNQTRQNQTPTTQSPF